MTFVFPLLYWRYDDSLELRERRIGYDWREEKAYSFVIEVRKARRSCNDGECIF